MSKEDAPTFPRLANIEAGKDMPAVSVALSAGESFFRFLDSSVFIANFSQP